MADTKLNLVTESATDSITATEVETPSAALGSVNLSADATRKSAPLSAMDAIQKYSHCSQCQSRLHFSYITDFSKNLTQETARCPECHFQAHRAMHRLQ